jgi:hypothetical protein
MIKIGPGPSFSGISWGSGVPYGAVNNDPPTAPTRGGKTNISRYVRGRTETRFGICTPRALDIWSWFSCWSTNMRFRRRPGCPRHPRRARYNCCKLRFLLRRSAVQAGYQKGFCGHALLWHVPMRRRIAGASICGPDSGLAGPLCKHEGEEGQDGNESKPEHEKRSTPAATTRSCTATCNGRLSRRVYCMSKLFPGHPPNTLGPRLHPDFEAPDAKTSTIVKKSICMNSDRKICARSAPTISSK